MDIYALIKGESQPVYYANSQTEHAQHFKDVRQGSGGTELLETIRYQQKVDVCAVLVGVNFYSGNAPAGVNGLLKIRHGEKRQQQNFTIAARSGNKGADIMQVFGTSESSQHSFVFALSDVLGTSECAA